MKISASTLLSKFSKFSKFFKIKGMDFKRILNQRKPIQQHKSRRRPIKETPLDTAKIERTSETELAELEQQLLNKQEEQLRQYHQEQNRLLRQIGFSNILLGFIVTLIFLTILKLTASFSVPIFVGLLIFMILFPQVEHLHKKWDLPYGLSCLIVLIVFHIIVFMFLIIISMAGVNSLLQAIPIYQEKLQEWLNYLGDIPNQYGIDVTRTTDWNFLEQGLSSASGILTSISSSVSNLFSSFITIFLVLLFMLLEGKAFFGTIERSFTKERGQSIIKIYRSSVEQISFYLLLKVGISLLTSTVIGVGLSILQVDFPIVWAILSFVLNFIPSIGSIFHTVIVSLFSLLQFNHNLYIPLIVVLFLGLVQFFIGNYLEPRIQGSRLQLSPIFILLSLYVWGYIWGIVGMILAVPILSVIKIICQNTPKLQTMAYFLENHSSTQ